MTSMVAEAIYSSIFNSGIHLSFLWWYGFNSTAQLFEKHNYTLFGEGKGLLDAWKDLQTRATRDAFMGQISAIILSKRFAHANIKNLLDFMNRRAEIPSETYVMVAKSDPEHLIDRRLLNNFVPGTNILRYLQSITKSSLAIPVRLWQVDATLTNGNPNLHMPLIEASQGLYRIAGMISEFFISCHPAFGTFTR